MNNLYGKIQRGDFIFSWLNSNLPITKEYSKFNKLCKPVISKTKGKCYAAIGNAESVKITLVQYDLFFILSQFSISEK